MTASRCSKAEIVRVAFLQKSWDEWKAGEAGGSTDSLLLSRCASRVTVLADTAATRRSCFGQEFCSCSH